MRLLIGLWKVLNWAMVIALLLSYLAPLVNPTIFWPIAIFGVLYPWLLLVNTILVLGWLMARSAFARWPALALLLGIGYIPHVVGFKVKGGHSKGGNGFKVISFNAHALKKPEKKTRLDPDSWNQFVVDFNADILAFQEFPTIIQRGESFAPYRQQLSEFKSVAGGDRGGLVIYTKYPMLYQKSIYFANKSNGLLIADLSINGKRVRVINAHLQSNNITRLAKKVSEEGQINNLETWSHIHRMIRRYTQNSYLRIDQATFLAALIKESPYPVVLLGDLNDVPLSYCYRLFANGLVDTFYDRGHQLGITYSGKVPGLRIDYIFTDPSLSVMDAGIVEKSVAVSDHCPVFAEVAWKTEN